MEIVALCRTGFEKEVAAELADLAAALGLSGYPKTRPGQGYVQFIFADFESAWACISGTNFQDLIFIRDWFVSPGELQALDTEDRVGPLASQFREAFTQEALEPGELLALNIDTNEGKALLKLTRGLVGHLKRKLTFTVDAVACASLVLTSGTSGFLGLSPLQSRPRWPGGIPRLKLPRQAPSRATLKLEEAWHHFIASSDWPQRLAPGMKAVDLGAAPGGWTWQLVQKSMRVHAVDNGPMDTQLMESGQVKHHRMDGFVFQPDKPVDWLVCDIADKPARVANMIARWAEQGWCREAVFNLKLPMKQRYRAVRECAQLIEQRLVAAGRAHRLQFKQLYHDREEVTGSLRLF